MASPRSRKRDIDKARREKQAAKRERRAQGPEAGADEAGTTLPEEAQGRVIESLRLLHERFDAGGMTFEEFEEARSGLLAQLQV